MIAFTEIELAGYDGVVVRESFQQVTNGLRRALMYNEGTLIVHPIGTDQPVAVNPAHVRLVRPYPITHGPETDARSDIPF
jgi:hypothetical protein